MLKDILIVYDANPGWRGKKIVCGKAIINNIEQGPEGEEEESNQPGSNKEITSRTFAATDALPHVGPLTLINADIAQIDGP